STIRHRRQFTVVSPIANVPATTSATYRTTPTAPSTSLRLTLTGSVPSSRACFGFVSAGRSGSSLPTTSQATAAKTATTTTTATATITIAAATRPTSPRSTLSTTSGALVV